MMTYNDGYTNTAELDFKVSVLDPCETALLDLSQVMSAAFNDSISTYNIGNREMIKSFDPTKVTSSETIVTCP